MSNLIPVQNSYHEYIWSKNKICALLPSAGNRNNNDGSFNNQGSNGFLWSSSLAGTNSRNLNFNSSNAEWNSNNRTNGFSVRCVRDKKIRVKA